MQEAELKHYLSEKYQGWSSFRDNVVLPIFGEEDYEDNYETELLDNIPERRHLADTTGIKSIKQCASIYVNGEPLFIFDITVADRIMMERNRVGIQRLIRDVMEHYSGAFMIFHYEEDKRWDWRFSFCYKGTSEDESTDRKRYTFLLGPGQSCRTAAINFCELSKTRENGKTLVYQDLIDAFSVEALSDEFFNGYKKIYEDIIQFITGKRMVKVNNKWEEQVKNDPCKYIMQEFARFADPEKAVRDYVKKLMGRLVFLQFLQKKGWLGVPQNGMWGEGDHEFIQKLFNECDDKEHFIDNVLEVLFNDLNTEREGDNSQLSVFNYQFKVPYLNGGLFERDATDETNFPLPAKYMEDMLEFFSRYNFTIDENDPNDAEVGVDPEMLGRIFENLLEDNKDKGAFYTPKEIVTYMCRESLIAYLQTDQNEECKESIRQFVTTHNAELLGNMKLEIDQRLKDVKICDPAIGSGAFPMGLLKELFLCRTSLEGIEQSKASEIKKHIIQNNIYGVDLEKGAVDIARLRFWLSLIVDEETPQALPNLDYKIVEGNSLMTTFDGQYIYLSTSGEDSLRGSLAAIIREKKELQEEQKRFFTLSGEEKYRSEIAIKQHMLNVIWYQLDYEKHSWGNIQVTQTDLFGRSKKNTKRGKRTIKFTPERQMVLDKCEMLMSQLNDESKALQERARTNISFFEWETVFSDIFENKNKKGFDIVIGNPPYVEAKKLKYIASTLKGLYNVYSGTADLSIYFNELGLNLLANDGIISFITTNKFFNTGYGEKVREQLSSHSINIIINFEQVEVFEDVLVSSVIFNISKSERQQNHQFTYEKFYKLNYKEFKREFVIRQSNFGCYSQDYLDTREWSFADLTQLQLKDKIESGNTVIKNLDGVKVYRGVTTGYNPAFIITDEQRDELIAKSPKNADVIKNMLQGRNIRKWYYNESEENMIFTRRGINIRYYPEIKKHLQFFYEQLKPKKKSTDESGRKPGSYEWYEILDNTAYYPHFEKDEKIIWGLTADKWAYTLDTKQHYLPSNAYILTSKKIPTRYILGLLNSKLLSYYFGFIGVMTAGGAYTLKAATIEALPMVVGTKEQQKDIILRVNSILMAKSRNKDSDVTKEEQEIDHLVYHLYGLTYDEVLIVDPETPITREEYEQNI